LHWASGQSITLTPPASYISRAATASVGELDRGAHHGIPLIGVRHADRQSYTGHLWYRTKVELTADQAAGTLHIHFPGLFNECWLYINGQEVAYRKQGKLWWLNDYRFEWDADLSGKLKAGKNDIALRCNCEHHFGGMFRRAFLYRKVAQ
jgi:hypothetical protein